MQRYLHRYGLHGPGIESRWGARFSAPLGPTQHPVQWVPGLFPGSKAAEAWRWPPTRGPRLKKEYSYNSTSPLGLHVLFKDELYISAWLQVIKFPSDFIEIDPHVCTNAIILKSVGHSRPLFAPQKYRWEDTENTKYTNDQISAPVQNRPLETAHTMIPPQPTNSHAYSRPQSQSSCEWKQYHRLSHNTFQSTINCRLTRHGPGLRSPSTSTATSDMCNKNVKLTLPREWVLNSWRVRTRKRSSAVSVHLSVRK
jgi:hypothetical protein